MSERAREAGKHRKMKTKIEEQPGKEKRKRLRLPFCESLCRSLVSQRYSFLAVVLSFGDVYSLRSFVHAL